MQRLRIFISSPGDVGQERLIAARAVERLQGEFSHALTLEPVLWEHEPLRATAHFQDEIASPSKCDVVVCILWSRLGTRLPGHFRRADGTEYASGTEWEFEDAANSFLARGVPDMLVYRKTQMPQADLANEAEVLEKLRQKKALDDFLGRWFGDAATGFTNAFHAFQTPEQFEQLIEAHLRRLLQAKAAQAPEADGAAPPPARWRQGSPFRGLESFGYEHASVFFGRTRAIGEIREALVERARRGAAFVLVLAASGSGKSSLLRAGLLPTICQPGVIEGVGLWRRCEIRPGDGAGDLFGALATALLGETAFPTLPSAGFDRAGLVRLLRESPAGAASAIRAGLAQEAARVAQRERLARAPEARLAILLDQLEELFDQDRVAPGEAARFVELVAELARSGVVWVVAAMRSDFYHRAAEIPALLGLSEGAGQRHLPPPDVAEIGQMIRLPARAAGVRFEAADGRRLDDVLHEAAARDSSALPLLSFALDELFKRRSAEGVLTFAAYETLGGLEGALAGRAEEAFQSLPEHVRASLPEVLRALVSIGRDEGDPATARRAPLEAVAGGESRSALVEAFVEARLLVADSGEGGATLRFAHEALLRRWPRLAAWLQEDREFLRVSARMAEAERRWRDEGQAPEFLLPEGKPLGEGADLLRRRREDLDADVVAYIESSIATVEARQRALAAEQKRRLQRSRVAAAAFAAIAALAGGAGWYGLNERRAANVQREVAVIRAAEAMTAGAEAKRQAEAALREQRRADSARRAAEVARLRAETQGRVGLQAQSLFLADAARRSIAAGDVETAMLLALEALPDPERDQPRPYVPRAEAALHEAVASYRFRQLLEGVSAPATALAWSPDGARLAAVSADGGLRVWLPGRSARPAIAEQAHRARATAVAFAPDGRTLATAAADGSLELWDVASGRRRTLPGHDAAIIDVTFGPGGERLVSAGWDGARLWDVAKGAPLRSLKTPGDRLVRIAFDGRRLSALGWSGESWSWDASGKKLAPADFDPQGSKLETTSPDGRRLAMATREGDVVVQAVQPARAATAFAAHDDRISRIAASPDGRLLVTASWNGEAKLWTFPDGRLRARLAGHAAKLHDVAFSPDGGLVATASRDRTVRLWNSRDAALVAVLQGHDDDVRDVEFSPDGSLLATASDDGRARLFDIESGRLLRALEGDPQGVRRVSFGRDGRRLVAAGLGGLVRAWSVEGALLATFEGLRGAATRAAFDVDGDLVVGASTAGETLVWRVADGTMLAELDPHDGAVWHLAFNPAGDRLLTASADGAVRVWSARTWRLLATSRGHGAPIEQAIFTPDGARIVTAATDGAVWLLDAASGEDLARLVSHPRALTDAAVTPDGRYVAAAAMDGGAWIAAIFPSTEALVQHARSLVTRELSPMERRRFFLGGQR